MVPSVKNYKFLEYHRRMMLVVDDICGYDLNSQKSLILIYHIADKIVYSEQVVMKIMILIEKTRKYRYAKENEIEETLNTLSYKEVKESKRG